MEDLILWAIGMGLTFELAFLSLPVGKLLAKKERDKDDDRMILAWIVLFFAYFMGAKEYIKHKR